MLSYLEKLDLKDAVDVVYHLIKILNKQASCDDEVELQLNKIPAELNEEQHIIVDNYLEAINYDELEDEIIMQHISTLYNFLENKIIMEKGIDVSRGKHLLDELTKDF
ncbi:hypothetical protein [Paenibacillus urinalis]|uniref:hypothetical protein n=1 Tax=Paenibacillus urinalis TaxID=521520 RepID=UPI001961BA6C